MIARAWDILGYPEMSQGILRTTWTWDISGYPEMSQGIKGSVGYLKTLDGNPGQLWQTHQYLRNGSHQLITVDQCISVLTRGIGNIYQNAHHLHGKLCSKTSSL